MEHIISHELAINFFVDSSRGKKRQGDTQVSPCLGMLVITHYLLIG